MRKFSVQLGYAFYEGGAQVWESDYFDVEFEPEEGQDSATGDQLHEELKELAWEAFCQTPLSNLISVAFYNMLTWEEQDVDDGKWDEDEDN